MSIIENVGQLILNCLFKGRKMLRASTRLVVMIAGVLHSILIFRYKSILP